MYKLIIKFENGSKHELPLDHPCYNDLIDQIRKDNVHWVEDYINTEIYWYIRMNNLWDDKLEYYQLLDPKGNVLDY